MTPVHQMVEVSMFSAEEVVVGVVGNYALPELPELEILSRLS